MSKKSDNAAADMTDVAIAKPNTGLLLLQRPESLDSNLPAFARLDADDTSVKELLSYITPPRLKVIQNQKTEKYKDFEAGDIVLAPQAILFAKKEQPFNFVPLLFFPEWATANPWELKDKLPMFVKGSRTRDPESEVARKARDGDLRGADKCLDEHSNVMKSKDGKDCYVKHIEFLTYIVMIVGHKEFTGFMVTMSFAKGEHKVGASFNLKVVARGCKMWACVFEGKVPKDERRNSDGAWFGIDVDNPSSPGNPGPYVTDEGEFRKLEEMHVDLVQKASLDLLRPDVSDEDDFAPAGANETKF